MPAIQWTKLSDGTHRAEIGNVSLNAVPVTWKGSKPARGTEWRACVNIWDEKTRCLSRYGLDVYETKFKTAKEAIRMAEAVYNAAQMPETATP